MAASLTKQFLSALSLCCLFPVAAAMAGEDRALSFKVAKGVSSGQVTYHEDGERTVRYFHGGRYDSAALDEINALLRDRDSGSTAAIDPGLLDLLHDLKTRLEAKHPGKEIAFHVISGYRSPATNNGLRADPANPYRAAVAKNSMHTHARALDIFVPGIDGTELRDAAWCLQQGGVGWYPQFYPQFPHRYIHVDTGRVRTWGFDPSTVSCKP